MWLLPSCHLGLSSEVSSSERPSLMTLAEAARYLDMSTYPQNVTLVYLGTVIPSFLPLSLSPSLSLHPPPTHLWHMEVSTLGVELKCSCRPTLEPQQWWIQATPVTYTTAWGHIISLTHWVRPGIEPTSSQRQCQALNLLSHNGNSSFLFKNSIESSCFNSWL